ncbi:MAG: phosphonate C-P lyase system protein PhnG [Herminiimonas sp.]|nr:phosphonate C-P lyase system protein PhnG [Herminiimonas sp.]
MSNSTLHLDRSRWMSLLARAPTAVLSQAVNAFGTFPAYTWLRRPQIGLAMVRARTGGTGAQFNLGEMSITRCALRLDSGEMGVAYVTGRDARHAEWAALFDALMQTTARHLVRSMVLEPIEAALAARLADTQQKAQATRVDFMTMVRGEAA